MYLNNLSACEVHKFPSLGATDDEDVESERREMQVAALKWLGSSDLLGTVMASMSDLMDVMDNVKDKEKGGSLFIIIPPIPI